MARVTNKAADPAEGGQGQAKEYPPGQDHYIGKGLRPHTARL